MSNTSIRIDVRRDDGEATRMVGQSGIAACAPALDEDVKMSEPATVSLRCGDAAELAWNLATLLATIRHISPQAYAARRSHCVVVTSASSVSTGRTSCCAMSGRRSSGRTGASGAPTARGRDDAAPA